jgi:putative phosphoribosyl transferase
VLVGHLTSYAGREDVTVLALPRGGAPVAHPIALALRAPLDVLAVRKLGVPGHEELAMGAIAAGGIRVLNDDVIHGLSITPDVVEAVTGAELVRLAAQEDRFGPDRLRAPIAGRVVILVDDGLATGSTMEAAVASARRAGAAGLVVAVPVGAAPTLTRLRHLADDLVCPATPTPFGAVGLAYADFSPVTDDDVVNLLIAGRGPGW